MYGRIRAILNSVKLSKSVVGWIWVECAMVAIKTSNVLVDKYDEKCAHEKFCRIKLGYSKHLRKLGELGTVRSYNKKTKAKLEYRGIVYIFMRYVEDHSGDVFRMYNMEKVIKNMGCVMVMKDIQNLAGNW